MALVYWLLSKSLWAAATVLWLLGFTQARKRFNGLSKLLWKKRKQVIRRRVEWIAAREAARRERLAEQEERARQREAKAREEEELRKKRLLADPQLNTSNVDIHLARLRRHGISRFRGEVEFMGPRGGIYTITASGNRNYR